MSTAAQPIKVLAGPLTFLEALDVQPLPSSFLLLMEFRSSCCGMEAPCSCWRPAESGRTPAGTPRCLSCPPPVTPWKQPLMPLSAFKCLQLSCLQAEMVSTLRTHKERLCLPGEPRGCSITLIPSAESSLSLSRTQSQVQEKQGLSIFGGHDSTGLVIMDWKRKKQRINNATAPDNPRLLPLSRSVACTPFLTLLPGPRLSSSGSCRAEWKEPSSRSFFLGRH